MWKHGSGKYVRIYNNLKWMGAKETGKCLYTCRKIRIMIDMCFILELNKTSGPDNESKYRLGESSDIIREMYDTWQNNNKRYNKINVYC